MAETDELPAWGEAALEEYKAHRAAFLNTEGAAQRTLAFGVAAIGILVAGAFNVWDSPDPLPATALLLVLIPLVSALVLVQWAGQMLHLAQRGRYLQTIEHTIRDAYPCLPATLFTWEDQFDKRHGISGTARWKPDLRWYMHGAMPVFGLVAVGSLGLGVYKGFESSWPVVVVIACIELLLLISVADWLTRELIFDSRRGPPRAAKVEPPFA